MAASRYFLVRMLSVFFLVQAVCLFVPRERMDVVVGLTTACQQDTDDRLDFGAQQRELTSRFVVGWRSQVSQQQHPKAMPDPVVVGSIVTDYGLLGPNGYIAPFGSPTSPPPVPGRAC